jgi:hypothetical protein
MRAHDIGHTVLEAARQPKQNRVAEAQIGDLGQEALIAHLAQLKNTASVRLATEVDTHANQPIRRRQIVVPFTRMAGVRQHAVHASRKHAQRPAGRQDLDHREKNWIVHRDMQALERAVVRHPKVCANMFIGRRREEGGIETRQDHRQQVRRQQTREMEATPFIELTLARSKFLRRPREVRSGSIELDQAVVHGS